MCKQLVRKASSWVGGKGEKGDVYLLGVVEQNQVCL